MLAIERSKLASRAQRKDTALQYAARKLILTNPQLFKTPPRPTLSATSDKTSRQQTKPFPPSGQPQPQLQPQPQPQPQPQLQLQDIITLQNQSMVSAFSTIKLPTVPLPMWEGKLENFLEFWGQFEDLVHSNPTLSGTQKFHYLKSCLKGEAKKLLTGATTGNMTYQMARDIPEKRFGQDDIIRNLFLHKLNSLTEPTASWKSQKDFLDEAQGII
jgi:hypothetical protein